MNKKNSKDKTDIKTPSTFYNDGQPQNAFEQVNFYGTYEIQPTQNSTNTYPAIGQGLNKKEVEKLEKESKRWLAEDDSEPHSDVYVDT